MDCWDTCMHTYKHFTVQQTFFISIKSCQTKDNAIYINVFILWEMYTFTCATKDGYWFSTLSSIIRYVD